MHFETTKILYRHVIRAWFVLSINYSTMLLTKTDTTLLASFTGQWHFCERRISEVKNDTRSTRGTQLVTAQYHVKANIINFRKNIESRTSVRTCSRNARHGLRRFSRCGRRSQTRIRYDDATHFDRSLNASLTRVHLLISVKHTVFHFSRYIFIPRQ